MEEKLITPEYSENYLGRRAFFFSEKDVRTLRDIAVLRKIGFSISDIRAIQNDPQQSAGIIDGLRRRIEVAVAEKQACLDALNTLDEHGAYTLSDLANALQHPVEKTPLPQEDSRVTLRSALRCLGRILLKAVRFCLVAFFLFVPFSWVSVLIAQNGRPEYLYPHLADGMDAFWILSPALLMLLTLIIDRILVPLKRWIFILAYCLCSVLMGVSFMFMFVLSDTESMTRDSMDYRTIDRDCAAFGDPFYEALFPPDPFDFEYLSAQKEDTLLEVRYMDSVYFYRHYIWGNHTHRWGRLKRSTGGITDTIYGEWTLNPDRFDEEVQRASALFTGGSSQDGYQISTLQRNGWTILFRYRGNGPFVEETGDAYRYYIFAWHPNRQRVRYLFCDTEKEPYYDTEQPYYLELDW